MSMFLKMCVSKIIKNRQKVVIFGVFRDICGVHSGHLRPQKLVLGNFLDRKVTKKSDKIVFFMFSKVTMINLWVMMRKVLFYSDRAVSRMRPEMTRIRFDLCKTVNT